MHKEEYLPNSFSGNMLSAFSLKNRKHVVNVRHGEESSIDRVLKTGEVENVTTRGSDEFINEKETAKSFNILKSKYKYKYKPINSYVS